LQRRRGLWIAPTTAWSLSATLVAQFNHCWIGAHLDINTIQKLATRAFKAAQQYAFGRRGRPRFKGRNQILRHQQSDRQSVVAAERQS